MLKDLVAILKKQFPAGKLRVAEEQMVFVMSMENIENYGLQRFKDDINLILRIHWTMEDLSQVETEQDVQDDAVVMKFTYSPAASREGLEIQEEVK